MKAINHIIIPGRGQAGIIVSEPVAFNDDHVVLVNFTDCIYYIHVGLFQ